MVSGLGESVSKLFCLCNLGSTCFFVDESNIFELSHFLFDSTGLLPLPVVSCVALKLSGAHGGALLELLLLLFVSSKVAFLFCIFSRSSLIFSLDRKFCT
uniref:Uncharacterized protein n=1 Tax=Cacopsylla melanoneura TaxID=428564 RepID=A0A8D8Q4U4_9HEMI